MDRNGRKRRVTIGAAALLATLIPVAAYAQDNACTTYNEAPQLAAKVAAGDLPPVAERLPEHPVVLTPAEQIGTYGGIMNSLYDGGRVADFRMYGYEGLVRWSPDGNEVVPNIAESWEVNEDGTRYTFHLRKGMKWSDGQPFTADDILFWWDRVENNPDIVPTPYSIYLVKGEAAKVEKIDDYTVAFSWSNPNGLFLLNLAAAYGTRIGQFAKHYLEQFDNKANPEGVAKMMAEAGQTTYGTWWISRVGTYGQPAEYNDPKRPLLQAWIPTEPYIGAERFTFVRNPYYFKVDTACNQLPYIDGRTFTLATDPQLRVLKTVSGEDFLSRDDVSQPVNRSVFFDNQQAAISTSSTCRAATSTPCCCISSSTILTSRRERSSTTRTSASACRWRWIARPSSTRYSFRRESPGSRHRAPIRRSTTSNSPSSTPTTTRLPPMSIWTRSCRRRTPTASACARMVSGSSST